MVDVKKLPVVFNGKISAINTTKKGTMSILYLFGYLEKLVLSAVANWEQKNEDQDIEDVDLYVKTIYVDGGRMLKRLRPAPQGRAHRIRKRSNHVTVVVDALPTPDVDGMVAAAQEIINDADTQTEENQ